MKYFRKKNIKKDDVVVKIVLAHNIKIIALVDEVLNENSLKPSKYRIMPLDESKEIDSDMLLALTTALDNGQYLIPITSIRYAQPAFGETVEL